MYTGQTLATGQRAQDLLGRGVRRQALGHVRVHLRVTGAHVRRVTPRLRAWSAGRDRSREIT